MPRSDAKSSIHSSAARARRATMRTRVVAAFGALGALAVLALAAFLRPASEGFGTHEQLGMPPCTWTAVLHKPCPTCGMTTSFAHAANGSLLASFTTQPFGAFLALLTASIFWGALHVSATGSNLDRLYGVLLRPRSLWALGALLFAAWVYKLLTWSGVSG